MRCNGAKTGREIVFRGDIFSLILALLNPIFTESYYSRLILTNSKKNYIRAIQKNFAFK